MNINEDISQRINKINNDLIEAFASLAEPLGEFTEIMREFDKVLNSMPWHWKIRFKFSCFINRIKFFCIKLKEKVKVWKK